MAYSVSASRVITAPADKIFNLLADPSRHHEFDGSGSVQSASTESPTRLSLGAKFGMNMKIGMSYKISNEVVEFEENKLIGWRHFGHHVWRYELEANGDSTTVTETFDWTHARSRLLITLMGYPSKNLKSIHATLERLASVVE